MSDLELYGVETKDSRDPIFGPSADLEEARRLAQERGALLIAYKYQMSDSELVEDYGETGDD